MEHEQISYHWNLDLLIPKSMVKKLPQGLPFIKTHWKHDHETLSPEIPSSFQERDCIDLDSCTIGSVIFFGDADNQYFLQKKTADEILLWHSRYRDIAIRTDIQQVLTVLCNDDMVYRPWEDIDAIRGHLVRAGAYENYPEPVLVLPVFEFQNRSKGLSVDFNWMKGARSIMLNRLLVFDK